MTVTCPNCRYTGPSRTNISYVPKPVDPILVCLIIISTLFFIFPIFFLCCLYGQTMQKVSHSCQKCNSFFGETTAS